MIQLRDYQNEAVSAVYEHLRTRDDNPCVVIPTGGGKTPVMAQICKDAIGRWDGRVLVLAHVKELLEQTAETLSEMAPELDVGVYCAGLNSRDTEHSVIVASIHSIYRRAPELGRFDLVMIDECFPAGTLVDGRPIEQCRPGQLVWSYNHDTKQFERRPIVAVRRSLANELVRIVLADGRSLTCTPNHPIFTGAGYVAAASVVEGSHVYVRRMREGVHGSFPESDQGLSAAKPPNDLLQHGVLVQLPGAALLTSDERAQPHGGPRDTRQSLPRTQAHRPQPPCARRERYRTDRAPGHASERTAARLGGGIPYHDGQCQGRRTDILLRGFGPRGTAALCGGGRVFPQNTRAAEAGCDSGRDLTPIRVAHVEVYERGDQGGPALGRVCHPVYNLQVEGTGNFFAEGVLVHNCHMIPADGEGMYRTYLHDAARINPNVRLIGLTATPYRMKSGMICEPDHLLNHVCYEIGVKELIVAGYLCPLKTKSTRHKVDTGGLHVKRGEFVASETQDLMDTEELVRAACEEIIEYTQGRHSCLIFASGVDHGRHVRDVLREEHGVECECVFGETPSTHRDEVLGRFRGNGDGLFREPLPYLVNMNVLTTGFDAPNIDTIAMLRPTNSPGLYYQMVGRGFRTCEGKDDCLVLDFGGNVLRHGPVDAIRIEEQDGQKGEAPAKECPECHSLIAAGYRVCPDCGYEFPPPERKKHAPKASTEGILSGQVSFTEYEVEEVLYSVHHKRGAPDDHPKTMRVEYRVGWQQWQSEWICFEHNGWARKKAEDWWRERTDWPVPDTAAEAVELANQGVLCETLGIKVKRTVGEEYPEVAVYKLGPKPSNGCDRDGFVLTEDIPF